MTSFDSDQQCDSQKIIVSKSRKRRSHPLEWLVSHKNPYTGRPYLEADHMRVGESFMQDMLSVQGYYKSQSWSEYIDRNKNSHNDFMDIKLASKKRLYNALNVLGEKQQIMIDLCLLGKKLTETEKKFDLKQGSAKYILRHGLDCLKNIYG